MRNLPRIPAKGFTLVEFLVAVIIISFLGGVIYTTFSQGMQLWYRGQKSHDDSDLDFFIEKITRDLRNSFKYTTANAFVGTNQAMLFYTLMPAPNPSVPTEEPSLEQPVRVRYFLQKEAQAIMRLQESYQEILNPELHSDSPPKPVALKVLDASIQYYAYDEKSRSYHWLDQWQRPCLPLAVKWDLEYGDRLHPQKATNIMAVPAGGCS